jgi:DNA-binding transcriptional MocR family regulator
MNHCETNPENLMSTNGNSQGFAFCMSTLFDKGDDFFIETPTYHLFLKIAQDKKMNVIK